MFPIDKMAMKPVEVILQSIPLIKNSVEDEDEKALVCYLEKISMLLEIFEKNDVSLHTIDMNEKRSQIIQVVEYFDSVSGISKTIKENLKKTQHSLIRIFEIAEKNNIKLTRLSHFGTNVVELFFSIMRSKIRYMNLLEYSQLHFRAFMELVKLNASDYEYHSHTKSPSKCYNNNNGVNFEINDIKLTTPETKKKTIENILTENEGSNLDKKYCQQLVTHFSPRSRQLTIRETTTKEHNLQTLIDGLAECIVETFVHRDISFG
jgi:hypothetical protein